MRKIALVFAVSMMAFACDNGPKNKDNTAEVIQEADVLIEEVSYKSYGETITKDDPISANALFESYNMLAVNDTLSLKVTAQVKEVCKKKGCWMQVVLEDETTAMVRFKDYGFFMPEDIEGKTIIAEGKAFIEELSVDKQRHYAEDAGASAEEILAITEPKNNFSFLAHGVLVPEN